MIIRPVNVIPIEKALGNEFDLILFPIYQTRADYASEHGGTQPPLPDPSTRLKYWYDPRYAGMAEDDGEVEIYDVVARDPKTGQVKLGEDGRPRTTKLVLPRCIAGRVNIPYGETANEFPPDSVAARFAPWPNPIRLLHAEEELLPPGSPFGDYRVANRRLLDLERKQTTEDLGRFTAEDRAKLDRILQILEDRK